eukprot:6187583-Pleurochrysis_carterae.AAC.3
MGPGARAAGFALFMGMVVSSAFCLVGVCLLFRYYRKKRSLVRAGVHFTGCGWVGLAFAHSRTPVACTGTGSQHPHLKPAQQLTCARR